MTIPADSQCSDERHVWHLPVARHHQGGPQLDERCFCTRYTFETLPAGSAYANVYVEADGTPVRGPFPNTKGSDTGSAR